MMNPFFRIRESTLKVMIFFSKIFNCNSGGAISVRPALVALSPEKKPEAFVVISCSEKYVFINCKYSKAYTVMFSADLL
jgi:hypothetical protein